MCGIAGIVSLKPGQAVNRLNLESINQYMHKRGPDDAGFWYSDTQDVGLAHNRLSIIDPCTRSNQPMSYLNGRYVMTYNGEIYNYQALRNQLKTKGYHFETKSDAEVVIALYDCFAYEMLDMMRGMFSFAIWDNHNNHLFAARDPFGIKPFYYATLSDEFIFSSSVRSISHLSTLNLTESAAGWCGFLLHGSVPEPYTIYEQIRALPAGHYLQLSYRKQISLNSYFSIYDDYSTIDQNHQSTVNYDLIAEKLNESVDHHMVADVPVGLFLSSGVDSSAIAANVKDHSELVAFTLDFEEFDHQQNESALADQTAAQLNISHQVLKSELHNTDEVLIPFFSSMDQPSIDGLNVWMISKAVSQQGFKAVLSGLGGDEVFAGYPSFTDVPKFARFIKLFNKVPLPTALLAKLSSYYSNLSHPKFSGFISSSQQPFYRAYELKRNLYLNEELGLYFDENFISSGVDELDTNIESTTSQLDSLTNPYLRVSALEIDNYMKNQLLRDADWASMSHSLELRVPFIDRELIKVCASELVKEKSPRKNKIMKTIMTGHLPDSIFNRKKTGFETPVKNWLETNPQLQNWRTQPHLCDKQTPWARRWAHEVKTRFLN